MTGRRLILWDIDGTLVWWGAIGRGVFDRAVHEVVGRDPAGHGVSMGGKTDPQIALEILRTMSVDGPEAASHLPLVLEALHRQTAGAAAEFRSTGGTHPGVLAVLSRLAVTPGVIQTVLTGNVELATLTLDGNTVSGTKLILGNGLRGPIAPGPGGALLIK